MSLSTGHREAGTPERPLPLRGALGRTVVRAGDLVPACLRDPAAWFAFLLGCVASMVRSQAVSMDADEAATVSAAGRSWSDLWAMLHNIDGVHGLYYAGMKLWTGLFGTSDVALRAPSAVAIGGTALGVLVLGRRLADRQLALTAAVVVAVLPVSTWAGINARPFAFSALLATWSTIALLRAADTPSLARWCAYTAVTAVGVVENIYVVMLVPAHALTLLLLARRKGAVVRGFVAAGIVLAAVALPVLWEVHSQQEQIGDDGIRDPLGIARKIFVKQYFLGVTPATDSTPIWFTYLWKASAVLAACISFALVARLLWAERSRRLSPVAAVALPWIIVPTAAVAAYAVLVSPIYRPHYFTFTAPALALLVGGGLSRVRGRWARSAVVALVCVSFAAVYVSQRVTYAKSGYDWSTAAAIVKARAVPGDAVYFTPRFITGDVYDNVPARRLAVAYPDAFAGLTDLTAHVSGAESATLDGYSWRIDDVRGELTAHAHVWMVYGVDYPTSLIRHGEEVIAAAGFTPQYRWAGPRFGLIRYGRTAG
jgi:mannosyltransferase